MAEAHPLPGDEAHLWQLDLSEVAGKERIAAYEALLAPEEQVRYHRFRVDEGRRQYLGGRGLVRTVLSRYAPQVAASEWRFEAGEHGRPHLVGGEQLEGVSFNLSHTRGQALLLVAKGCLVGVDVERSEKGRHFVELAQRFFAPSEAEEILALPEHAQAARFYQYWTLKESYIKGRGMGLSIPLSQFAFRLGGESIQLHCEPELGDEGADWQFIQSQLTPEHPFACALRRGKEPDRRLLIRRETPFACSR